MSGQIGWWNYPPTAYQLWGGTSFVRLVTLGLLCLVLFLTYRTLKYDRKVALFSILLIISSPVSFVIGWCYPVEAIKWLIFAFIFWLVSNKYKNRTYLLITALFAIMILYFFGQYYRDGAKPVILDNLSLKRAQIIAIERFSREDEIDNRIRLPMIFRRVANNKYGLIIRDEIKEVMSFFSLEDIYFAEIHPNMKKEMPILFWPAVFWLILAIVYVRKSEKEVKLVLFLMTVALINYLVGGSEWWNRHSLTLWLVAYTSSLYLRNMSGRSFGLLTLFLYVYGFQAFYFDLTSRPDHWLDNRPLAYRYMFEKAIEAKSLVPGEITVSGRLGKGESFCRYYIANCSGVRVAGFDMKNDGDVSRGVYIGFVGEFIGRHSGNSFDDNWQSILEGKGVKVLDWIKLRDTIAYGYGDYIVFGLIE